MTIDFVPIPQEMGDLGVTGVGFFKYYGQPGMFAEDNPKVPFVDNSFVTPSSAEQELNSFGRTDVQLYLQDLYSIAVFTKQKDDPEAVLVYRADNIGVVTTGGAGGTDRVFDNPGNTVIVDEAGSKGAAFSAISDSSLQYLDVLALDWNAATRTMYYGDGTTAALSIIATEVSLGAPNGTGDVTLTNTNFDVALAANTNINLSAAGWTIESDAATSFVALSGVSAILTVGAGELEVTPTTFDLSTASGGVSNSNVDTTLSLGSDEVKVTPGAIELTASGALITNISSGGTLATINLNTTQFSVGIDNNLSTLSMTDTIFDVNVGVSGINGDMVLTENFFDVQVSSSTLRIDAGNNQFLQGIQGLSFNGAGTDLVFNANAKIEIAPNEILLTATGGTGDVNIDLDERVRVISGFSAASGVVLELEKQTAVSTANDNFILCIRASGSDISAIRMDAAGALFFSGAISDYRAKAEYTEDTGLLDRLSKVKIYQGELHKYHDNPSNFILTDYFIAHELGAEFPELIEGEKDAVDGDGKPVYQKVDHNTRFTRIIWQALREMNLKFEAYKTEMDAKNVDFETRLTNLENL